MKKTILLIILIVLGACNKANEKPKDLALNKSKLLPKANSAEPVRKISTDEAKRLAEKQFQKYLPKILDSHNAYLDSQDTFTGDFTGDGTDDVLICFSLAPKEGGNTIVGQGLVLYKNTGTNIKVIGGYEPDYLFNFKKVNSGKIYVEKLEYAETDGRCCPSIRTEHQLTISGTKIY